MESGDRACRREDEAGNRNGGGVVIEYLESTTELHERLGCSRVSGLEICLVFFGDSGRSYKFGTFGHWLDIEVRSGNHGC